MEKEMSAFEKIHVDIVYACMNRTLNKVCLKYLGLLPVQCVHNSVGDYISPIWINGTFCKYIL